MKFNFTKLNVNFQLNCTHFEFEILIYIWKIANETNECIDEYKLKKNNWSIRGPCFKISFKKFKVSQPIKILSKLVSYIVPHHCFSKLSESIIKHHYCAQDLISHSNILSILCEHQSMQSFFVT